MGNEERGEEVLNGKHELVRPQFLMTGWANCTRSRKGWLKVKKKKKKKAVSSRFRKNHQPLVATQTDHLPVNSRPNNSY